jgi:hypothetical protein
MLARAPASRRPRGPGGTSALDSTGPTGVARRGARYRKGRQDGPEARRPVAISPGCSSVADRLLALREGDRGGSVAGTGPFPIPVGSRTDFALCRRPPALPRPRYPVVELHSHAIPAERHAFHLQKQTLLLALRARECDPTAGGNHSVPRYPVPLLKRPDGQARGARKASGGGHLAVGHHLPSGHAGDQQP